MSKLQNNFTTPEQSKRLLELGIPINSADCYISNEKIFVLHNCTYQENFNDDLNLARLHLIDIPHYTPCWSVGRLIEIFAITIDSDFIDFDTYANSPCVLKELLEKYEKNIELLDFSKLDELI